MSNLVFFANDLRITDYEPLSRALRHDKRVHACYMFFKPALDKYGPKRNHFLLDGLILLAKDLSTLGVPLYALAAKSIAEAEEIF